MAFSTRKNKPTHTLHSFVQCLVCGLTEQKEHGKRSFCAACKTGQWKNQASSLLTNSYESIDLMEACAMYPGGPGSDPRLVYLSRAGPDKEWEEVVQLSFDDDKLMVRSIANGAIYHGSLLHARPRGERSK